jgi:hypothetical protein
LLAVPGGGRVAGGLFGLHGAAATHQCGIGFELDLRNHYGYRVK